MADKLNNSDIQNAIQGGAALRRVINTLSGLGPDAKPYSSESIITSEEVTGTGAPQDISHDLGVDPDVALPIWTTIGGSGVTYVENSTSATKINATITSGAKCILLLVSVPE